ncbi:hypothetical protein N5079_17620 [Planotetraspora sp. A-T 1434]|uniref:hypothetical protein n=1 Tax=Planotetraspora sp. A-T 1434 TaxID=2979219 RepID=UPI0021C1026A|nr:hypothetical protein [Planotetraspora sp. A-T 1434]MCT9932023.1 hypothetical protein [Planotetraspora sp. A-T 1434]
MTGDIVNLAAELQKLADSPAPPMSLDIAYARKAGRKRLNYRRFSMVGGAVAIALAIGLTVSPITAKAPTTVSAAMLSAGSNPLIARASFGWLPESIVGVSYQVGAHGDQVLARGAGDFGARIILSLYPAEHEPRLGNFADGREQIEIPAQPVKGRPARWVTRDDSDPLNEGDTYLRWQTTSGQWAELHSYYLNVADPQSVLLRIAADVTIGDRAIPLPLQIENLPADFKISEVELWRPPLQGTGAWELQMFYSASGSRISIDVRPKMNRSKSQRDSCVTATGLDLCVQIDGAMPTSLLAIGGTRGLLDRITLLGMDEHDWTTHVIG